MGRGKKQDVGLLYRSTTKMSEVEDERKTCQWQGGKGQGASAALHWHIKLKTENRYYFPSVMINQK